MSFQYTILRIAIFVLIISLVFFAYNMSTNKLEYPQNRIIGSCPDYWKLINQDNKLLCVNDKNLGKSTCSKTMNFNIQPYNLHDGMCKKFTWAKNCDLTWDGITNNANICKKKL